ncbi:MAG: hypothetical protein JO336_06820, partial [Acidobacteriia bacterium]|nr:hypothetical protein [Terriglobia bacterium]
MNEFAAMDLADVTPSALAGFDIAILGQMPLTAAQATMFMNWANGGGNLIAMRPDPQLAGLLGLTATGSTLTNAYLLVNTSALPGAGIVNQTIQFHGAADRYTLSGATTVATLYQTLTTATVNPAVTYRLTGAGTAAAFTYDLAQSVIYTRQGNPAWAGEPRDQYWDDNHSPNTTHDMFYGAAPFDPEPDWIDFNRIAIPQADEQQRLLVNLIEFLNLNRKPLPRFWYLPSNYKAVVVMTGDDHALGGTAGRFNQYLADSVAGCSVANWQCIRSTSLLYPGSPLTNAQAAAYQAQGFEVGFHVTSNCQAWTPSVLDSDTASQLGSWRNSYPSIASMYTNRIHCTVWSDWLSAAKIALKYGFRYEMSYSTGPNYWVMDRVGFQSGTGFSMRFGDVDGTMIDVYQGNNIVWDNDGAYSQTEPLWINTLLDNALGPLGYYAAVGVLAHTDNVQSSVSDAVVASAQARSVPVISGQQMLTWLDGRNGSSFGGLTWNSGVLAFSISPAAGSTGLQAMLPAQFGGRTLTALSIGGSPVGFSTQLMKGITYA